MKNVLKKYRGVIIILSSLIFNLLTSLLVWHPDGRLFNMRPMTITEWICDIVAIIGFFVGLTMSFYDVFDYEKQKIKEALLETDEELKNDDEAVIHLKAKEIEGE